MKRLWILKSRSTGKPSRNPLGEVVYFPNKIKAKEFRDALNQAPNHDLKVSPGPDHRRSQA